MLKYCRLVLAALALAAGIAACTPPGAPGLLPSIHTRPMDGGGGLPPGSGTQPSPTPTP